MEPLPLQPVVVALMGDGQRAPGQRCCQQPTIQAQRSILVNLEAAGTKGMSSHRTYPLPSCNIILTLNNSRISGMSLDNGPVFMVLQELETLIQNSKSVAMNIHI